MDLGPYVAIIISALTLVVLVVEKVFGGGNALAGKFHTLERDTNDRIAGVEREIRQQVMEYEKLSTVGFEATRNAITEIRVGLLELRAHTSESLHAYIRKDDYHAGINDVKRDMRDGFDRMDNRLGQVQDLITWANRLETNAA